MTVMNKLAKRIIRARGPAGTPQSPLGISTRPTGAGSAEPTPTKPTLPMGLRGSAPSAAPQRGALPGKAIGNRKRRRLS